MLRVLLDTNILIDYMVPDRPDSASAECIIEAAASGRIVVAVSAGSLKDVYYIVRKHYQESAVRSYISAFMDLMQVLAIDRAACVVALASDEPDFEDGIVRAISEVADMDFIVTRDMKAFASSQVRPISPSDLAHLIVSWK